MLRVLINSIETVPPERIVAAEILVFSDRRTAELHPRFYSHNRVVHGTYYTCDIFPTPLALVGRT